MASARGERVGVATGAAGSAAAEAGVRTVTDGLSEGVEPAGSSRLATPRGARKEPPGAAGAAVRAQPAGSIAVRAKPRMVRSPGCCRSPIKLLRQDLPPSGRCDGG